MKIAVTSAGETLDSAVDPRFGRAAYFIIVETETNDFEAVENASVSAAGGAGISSAKNVIDTGAVAVLTGNCGPNAQRTLDAASIKLYTGISGSVNDAVTAFKNGLLKESIEPNVQSHFGTSD